MFERRTVQCSRWQRVVLGFPCLNYCFRRGALFAMKLTNHGYYRSVQRLGAAGNKYIGVPSGNGWWTLCFMQEFLLSEEALLLLYGVGKHRYCRSMSRLEDPFRNIYNSVFSDTERVNFCFPCLNSCLREAVLI